MSYFSAAPLQEAVFGALQGDAGLAALIGGRVYDAPPEALEASATPYVLIGDEQVRDRSSSTHSAARHDLVVSIYSDAAGFADAKDVASAVCAALDGADLALGAVAVFPGPDRAQTRAGRAQHRFDFPRACAKRLTLTQKDFRYDSPKRQGSADQDRHDRHW